MKKITYETLSGQLLEPDAFAMIGDKIYTRAITTDSGSIVLEPHGEAIRSITILREDNEEVDVDEYYVYVVANNGTRHALNIARLRKQDKGGRRYDESYGTASEPDPDRYAAARNAIDAFDYGAYGFKLEDYGLLVRREGVHWVWFVALHSPSQGSYVIEREEPMHIVFKPDTAQVESIYLERGVWW